MRNLKKVLSLVLCLAMMLSIMVMGAGAAFTDQDKIVNKEAVDMCAALNIINGYEDNSYRPEGNITRAETTKLIAMMLNGGRDASMALPTTPSFSDVKTSPNSKWAEKYIEYCAAAGIVCGWDGIFAPDNNVTATEAAKMLLVSLGYDAVKEGFEGGQWAVNVNVKAAQVGLYDGLKTMDVNAPLTRDNAAQMIWNALNAKVVKYSAAGQAIGMNYSLLNDAYNADATTAIMTDINAYNKDATVYEYTLSNGVKVTSKVDYSDDFAKNVSVVYNSKKEALNIFASKDAVVAEGTLGDIDNYKALGTKTTVVINGEKFGVDNKAGNITLNVVNFNQYSDAAFDGTQANAVGIWNNKVAVQYGFRAIDTDNGGDIDTIVVYPYAVLSVDDVDNDDFTVSQITKDDAKLFPANGTQYYAENGLKTNVDFDDVIVNGTLATNGYVKYVPAVNTAKGIDTYTALTVQSATPTSLNTKDQMVTLNGKEYNGTLLTPNTEFQAISLTKNYNFVEVNGYLFMMDGAGVMAPVNYAVVTDVAADTTGTTAKVYKTDLLLTTGETVTVDAKVVDSKPYVGKMYTYSVDKANNYVLTEVVDNASYEANTSIYDVQEAYKTGACLANSAGNYGVEKAYGVDAAGNQYFTWAAGDNTRYYIKDDAKIFVFYSGDEYYDVITGADLKAADLGTADVNWAFTGANKPANGGTAEVELGYVALDHDLGEVIYEAYIDSVSHRTGSSNDFYAYVNVMLPGGTMKTLETKHCESQDDALIKALYAVEEGAIYSVTLLNDKVVHVGDKVTTKDVTVRDAFSATISGFVGDDAVTYVVDKNTKVYSLNGKDLTAINKGDKVSVLAGDVEDGVAILKTLVYTD